MLFESLAGSATSHRLALTRELPRRFLLLLKHFTSVESTWARIEHTEAKLGHKEAAQDDVEVLYRVVLIKYDHASGALHDLEVIANNR